MMETREIEREFLRAMRRFGKVNLSNMFSGISHGEFAVMATLERYCEQQGGEGARASVLAKLVESSPQALSRTLRGLEQKGYIERRVDHRDRRNACICLTEAAHDVMEKRKRQLQSMFEQVVVQMGEDEIRELIALLNRLVDAMQRVSCQEAKVDDGCADSLNRRGEEETDKTGTDKKENEGCLEY